MAKTNTYTYADPNAGGLIRSAQGDSSSIFSYGVCQGGLAIKIFDDATEVLFSCYTSGTLVITPNNEGVDPIQQYDCINGGCIPKATYNTLGKYASLAACQSGCAKDSNCTGECVSAAELAALQQAANNLQSKFCK
jgi:hypothetical protein